MFLRFLVRRRRILGELFRREGARQQIPYPNQESLKSAVKGAQVL